MSGTLLLDGVSVDTTGTGISGNGTNLIVYVWGTDFGGGTVNIQCSPDEGTTWFDCQKKSGLIAGSTAKDCFQLQPLANNVLIRAVLSGATNPVGVSTKVLSY